MNEEKQAEEVLISLRKLEDESPDGTS